MWRAGHSTSEVDSIRIRRDAPRSGGGAGDVEGGDRLESSAMGHEGPGARSGPGYQ
jgi:hypothetical protein